MKATPAVLVAALSITLTGCWFGKKKAPQVPLNLPKPASGPPPSSTLPPLPQEPFPQETKPAVPPPQAQPQPQLPAPTQSSPAQKKRPQKPSPAPKQVESPKVETPEQEAAPQPPATPRLGEVLSNDTRRQYEAELNQHLSRARAALSQALAKRLNPAQTEKVQRIRSFIDQAENTRSTDLASALELARRADLLGQDLLASLL